MTYSKQDLKYAAEFREKIHREALAIVRKTNPNAEKVVDRHAVEEYFQKNWEYPGKWYSVVSIPYGYKSRRALIDKIVADTLAEKPPEREEADTKNRRDPALHQTNRPAAKPEEDDPFYSLIDEYPDIVVEYRLVKGAAHGGYEAHREALKTAYGALGDWEGDPDRAAGKPVPATDLFSAAYQDGKLGYRKAFLYPPHENGYTGKDFARVNAALFPNGTNELEVYEWDADWSDYFDEGKEWWGTLCLTVFDKTLERFTVIFASSTD